jgi:hypothetical protein
VGAALWLLAAVLAFAVARIIPSARPQRFLKELLLAAGAGLVIGVTATALDFGGWGEPDWRAALFVLFGGLAILAAARLVTVLRTMVHLYHGREER